MVKPVEFEVNGEKVTLTGNTVKNYLVHGNGDVSDQELVMFINLCKFQKLNPFLNEAYLVKFGSQPAQIIVSKEAFMKRAENHSKYEGFQAGIIVERNEELVEIEGAVKLKNDVLLGGWCKVYRSDRKVPIISKISVEEFSKGQATWKQMPLNMIRKSAIVNGLREAFPESLGAMYTEDDAELRQAPKPEKTVEEEIKNNANSEVIDISYEEAPEETIHVDTAEQPSADGPTF
jgi:phage recombination protein Bet